MLTGYRSTKLGVVCVGLLAQVVVGAEERTVAHPEMRRAVLESFRYDPELRAKDEGPSSASQSEPVKNDPEVIVLPKFEVKERRVPRGLAEAIVRARPLEPQNHSRLGTGIHQADIGKVRVSAVTVLYVPVFLGLSW
jgi:hypothetical protein